MTLQWSIVNPVVLLVGRSGKTRSHVRPNLWLSSASLPCQIWSYFHMIMARSPPRFWQVLRASLQFRVGMLMMRKHDFSRRTQPSGQAGPVTERDQIKMELSLRIRSLILSKADREIESPFYFNSELTQFTFIRDRVYLGFDINQQLSFNFSEAPVVDVKRLAS